jgi:hypothetical protein
VAELLAGKKVEMPAIKQVQATFKKAPKVTKPEGEQGGVTTVTVVLRRKKGMTS